MATQQTRDGLEYIIQAITNIVEPKVDTLKYDKTYRAKVITKVDEGVYKVQIAGIEYQLSYGGTLNVGDIVKVKAPLNNFSDIYIEALPGSGGGGGGTTNYNDLTNKPILNTNITTAQTPNASEIIRETISLHKVSKTGNYSDLNNLPSLNFIPTSQKGAANGVAELDSNVKVPKAQLPSDTVYDSNYVHTDNNFTNILKNKLDDIQAGAQQNIIESIERNGVTLTVSNKTVNIDVPTDLSDLNNDMGFITDTVNNLTNYYTKSATDTLLNGKQATLVSGTNIKTVNGTSILGNGNIAINVPTTTSELTNDSGFITNSTNSLVNYYLKSDTYNKTEVNNLIAGIVGGLKFEIVETLPTTNIDPTTIYLVPASSSSEDNIYDEYIYINGDWELIGSTAADFTNYYTKTETDNLLNAKQATLVSGTNIKTINGISLLGSGNITTATKTSDLTNDGASGTPFISSIPIASTSQLGGIKVGANLTIAGDGTLSAVVATVVDNLTSTSVVNALSAKQGKMLNDSKQNNITGGATTITSSNLTASRVLVSDTNGKVAVSAVTSTELSYLDGVTSAIQTQINAKATKLDCYPVGAYYISNSGTNPSSLFGGTWVALTDRFLIGAGGSYSAGKTGGEVKHTLTIAEIPNHSHPVPTFKNYGTTGSSWTGVKISNTRDDADGGHTNVGTDPVGGGQAHNNMPPYRAVYMWYRSA